MSTVFSNTFVLQGVHEDEGLPRGTYANPELMKIPNFLHLTPAHIKKQCAAIKSKTFTYDNTVSCGITYDCN